MADRGGRRSHSLTQAVLSYWGTTCWLCLRPDAATEKDHVVPYSLGGTDDIANLRPICKRCNTRRGNRVLNGFGSKITVVIGPPASGKTTYVREHARPDAVVIDLDYIARALMPTDLGSTHVYPQYVRHVAIGARAAAIERATRLIGVELWIIHAVPDAAAMDTYRMLKYDIVTIDPGRATVERRFNEQRPEIMRKAVHKWYATWALTATPIAGQLEAAAPAPEPASATTHGDW